MNCANHPDVPVAAFCQTCGKPLCQDCVRNVGGVIYCEPCLTAKVNHPANHSGGSQPGRVPPGQPAAPYVGLPPVEGPNPGLALGLGFIPGVGAMYNGQFVKGTVHVIIFALLCSLSDHESFFGILIPFWIAYQVFDAFQTAKARRDGTVLPNPFGLNDLGYRLGLQPHPETPAAAGAPVGVPITGPAATPYSPSATAYGGGAPPFTPVAGPGPAIGFDPSAPPMAGFVSQGYQPGPPMPGVMQGTFGASGVPVGAVVLIGLGTLFLLSSLGIFRDEWIGRAWPLIIVGVGVFLLVRRTRETQSREAQLRDTFRDSATEVRPMDGQGGKIL